MASWWRAYPGSTEILPTSGAQTVLSTSHWLITDTGEQGPLFKIRSQATVFPFSSTLGYYIGG